MDIAQKIKFNFMILEMRCLRLIDKYLILSISFKKNKNAHLALGVIGDHYFMDPLQCLQTLKDILGIFL